MNGVIEGGWGYVAAAYGTTAGALMLYGAWLYVRARAARRALAAELKRTTASGSAP